MLRHVIAPSRAFAQIPNAILRHPRLSSDAKNLLAWQLSLPPGDRQCLSATARRAGIGKCAFQRAKRQLLEEGYLHEWRLRIDGGRFATVQLISNAPLNAEGALALRDGLRPLGAGPADGTGERPGAGFPTAGEPAGRAVGRPPEEDQKQYTSPPTASAPEPGQEQTSERDRSGQSAGTPARACETARQPSPTETAEALLRSLAHHDPRLALPHRTARLWAPLAAEWLNAGLAPEEVRHSLTQGLTGARSPLGVLRWRLEHALPARPQAPAPRPAPPLTDSRECTTRHTQPRLFTPPPGSSTELCPDCRTGPGTAPPSAPDPRKGPGFAAFRSARRAGRRSDRDRHPPLARTQKNRVPLDG